MEHIAAMWGRLTGLASSVAGLQSHDSEQVGIFLSVVLIKVLKLVWKRMVSLL